MEQRFTHYVHVDNGGYQISIVIPDKDCGAPHIDIQDSYFGYSTHHLSVNERVDVTNLMAFANIFRDAAEAVLKGHPPSEREIEQAEDM